MVWGGLAAVILLILVAFATSVMKPKPVAPSLPMLKVLPEFTLTNQHNQKVTLADLRGKVWVADIIFTFCGGPCPRMTKQLSQLQERLFAQPEVQIISLTADAENDTPEVLKRYAERFGANQERWWFLTGPQKDIYHLATKDGLLLAVEETDPAERTSEADLFVHSTIFVVVDKQGRVRAIHESDLPDANEKVLRDVKTLLNE